ncbi:hypothetical protein RJ641_027637 [Dillenia turbinata]|uniref:Uncharacterized protein n=1 Tax=Dillenia turbinata TaxID=194707 RepID=A0AAN8VXM6_9MAGN
MRKGGIIYNHLEEIPSFLWSMVTTSAKDLSQAIARVKEDNKFAIPLVVFGHMHTGLAYGGTQRAFTVVEVLNGQVIKIVETWISVFGDKTNIDEELILLRNDSLREL